MYVCMYIVCVCVCVCIYIHTYSMYVRMYVYCVCVCIYTYMHAYIHTYIVTHTCIYTYIYKHTTYMINMSNICIYIQSDDERGLPKKRGRPRKASVSATDIASAVGYGAPVAGMPPPALKLIKLTKPEETD